MESVSLQEITLQNFEIGSSSWVDITHINSPNSFYVRPISYRIYMPKLRIPGQKISALEVRLQMDVTYKSKMLKLYCRGNIFCVNDCSDVVTYDIFAIDYGFLEKNVPLYRICHPGHEYNVPPLSSHCQLADCNPKTIDWDHNIVDAMKCFIGAEKTKLLVRGKTCDKLIVELVNTCPDDIATMLALTGYTTLGYNNNMISRIPTLKSENHYYTFKEVQVGNTLYVRVQSGNNLNSFYVAQIDDYKEYITDREELMLFSKEKCCLRPEDMKINGPVSVYVPHYGRYERGIIKIITVPEEKAIVQLVDWGTDTEVSITRMKPLTSFYFLKPAICIYCSVEESQMWDNNLQKYLYPGNEFFITVKEIGTKFSKPNIVSISIKSL